MAVFLLIGLTGCNFVSAPLSVKVETEPKMEVPDIPISFEKRKNIGITFYEIYSMKMKEANYPIHFLDDFEAILCNYSGPEATSGLRYQLEYKKPPSWENVPFIDNLAFADIGFSLGKGDVQDFVIKRSLFKNKFEPGEYRVSTNLLVELFAEFDVVDGTLSVKPKASISKSKPFGITVSSVSLQNKNDSIVLTILNNSDLPVCMYMYPSILKKRDDNGWLRVYHPFTEGATIPVIHEIRRLTRMEGGTSMSFSIPVHWHSDSTDPQKRELLPGHYFCRQLLEVELSAEFFYGK